jgi:hypothetical protein
MTETLWRTPRQDPGVCYGVIYGYNTLRVDRRTGLVLDGTIEVGYVGQTVQDPAERDAQHRGRKPGPGESAVKCQPFSDVIYGEMFVIEVVPIDKLDEREMHHIQRLKPAYNHQLQSKDNPNRIQISDARRHRDARDAAKGLAPREWPPLRNPPKFLASPRATPSAPVRKRLKLPARWRARRNWAAGWLASVVVVWSLFAALAAKLHVAVGWSVPPVASAGLISAAFTLHLPKRKRKAAWAVITVVTLISIGIASKGE